MFLLINKILSKKHTLKPMLGLFLLLNLFACDDNFDVAIKNLKPVGPIQPEDYITPGNNGVITVNKIESTSIQISWEDAIIVNENSSGLLYEVYISSNNNLTSIETIRLNGKIIASGELINYATATGLEPENIYYLNVIVTLQSENIEILYNPVAILTKALDKIYMFATSPVQGDFGGRMGADDLCSETKINYYDSLPGTNVKSFISIDSTDDIIQMILNYTIPDDHGIFSPTETIIADNWSDMLDGNIINSLNSSDVIIGDDITGWWSGSKSDGTYNDSVSNCNGWTSTSESGIAGSPESIESDWMNLNNPNCSASRHILCVSW